MNATEPMKVRGSVLEARIQFMRDQGTRPFARFLTDLGKTSRQLADGGCRPEAWYDVTVFHEMLEVIDRQLGQGDLAFCYELGRYACDANLKLFHKFFLRWANIHQMMDRASAAWEVHYQGARLEIMERSETSFVVRIGTPTPHRGFCLSVKGWIIRMGEHTGEQLVERYETCCALGDESCVMAFDW